ncbi:hypothetical protein WR25_21029 [Diploscapter pachys]|uniref:Uncharacterized protein n=1 Tax=Diploscapter pachys TaxID=2018661 RepID=A0A2A2LJJ5_9BILA|nr:hypothetical protein WR25_18936 [Diploscapter pachys]PAV86433.1 hypothetical protein WR25_21029 [Diploscapter pachys]
MDSDCTDCRELIVTDDGRPLQRVAISDRRQDQFSYCGGRIHAVLLTKIISLLILPLYLLLLIFISYFGNATSIMFALLILGSVGGTTVYGAFQGSKMCLIPFLFLQTLLFAYDVFLIGLLLYAALRPDSFLSQMLIPTLSVLPLSSTVCLLFFALLLALLLPPLLWTTHVVYVDFLFISELDEYMEIWKEKEADLSPSRLNF